MAGKGRSTPAAPPGAQEAFEQVQALLNAGRHQAALSAARDLVARWPRWPPAHKALGSLLSAAGRDLEALPVLRQALKRMPDAPDLHANLGNCLSRLGQLADAERHYQQALRRRPRRASLWFNLALLRLKQGRVDDAISAYRHTTVLDPELIDAHLALVQLFDTPPDSPLGRWLAEVIADTQRAVVVRSQAGFALGKIRLDQGDDAGAFAAYDQANRLLYPTRAVNTDTRQYLERNSALFTAAFFAERRALALPDAELPACLPVLIVGMPRSGKSLAEGLLTGHPQVDAGGESYALRDALREVGNPAHLTDPAHAHRLARRLLEALPAGSGSRLTLTLPIHLWLLGTLGLLLPQVPVVLCYRDPLDLGVSCYFKYFSTEHGYSFDLGALGREIRLTEAMMDHWQAVLPNPVLRQDYERLVAAPEATARHLCAHSGLAWHEACLDGLSRDDRRMEHLGLATSLDLPMPISEAFVGVAARFGDALAPLQQGYSSCLDAPRDQGYPAAADGLSSAPPLKAIQQRLAAGYPAAAHAMITQALQHHPDHPRILRLQAIALSLLGQDDEALRQFATLLAHTPTDHPTYRGLWVNALRARLRAADWAGARQCLQQAPEGVAKDVPRLQVELSVASGTERAQAWSLADAALARQPDDPEWQSLAASLCPDPARAHVLHRQALARAPSAARWLRFAVTQHGHARRDALWQAALFRPFSRESVSAWHALSEAPCDPERLSQRLAEQ